MYSVANRTEIKGNSKRFVNMWISEAHILLCIFLQFHNYINITMVGYVAAGHMRIIHVNFYPNNAQLDAR